jgi:hypothetical protein
MASTPESSGCSSILHRPHHVLLPRPPNGLARTVQSREGDEVLMPAAATTVTAGAHRLRRPSNAPAAAAVHLVPTPAASVCPASVSRRRREACPPLRRRQGRVARVQGRVAPAPPSARWRTMSPAGAPTRAGSRVGRVCCRSCRGARPPPPASMATELVFLHRVASRGGVDGAGSASSTTRPDPASSREPSPESSG